MTRITAEEVATVAAIVVLMGTIGWIGDLAVRAVFG